jgi:HEAT repeat protein
MIRPRRSTILVLGSLLLLAVAAYEWYEMPERKVPRLLRELSNRPGGNVDLAFSGRSSEEVQTDLDRLGTSAVPPLIKALDDPNSSIRYLAAGQLGRLRDRRAVKPLIHSLQTDRDRVVRNWVAAALGDIGDPSAVEALIAILKDDDSGLRFCATEALGKIGDERAFRPLLTVLEDKELYPRAYAAEALGRIGEPGALEPLVKVLQGTDDSWVRSMAARGLGLLQDVRAVPALKAACDDESSKVKEEAKVALSALHRD